MLFGRSRRGGNARCAGVAGAPRCGDRLFGYEPSPWNGDAETIGTVVAAHAAAAILASREGMELQSALMTRDSIGQAKGMLMERFRIDDVGAFAMLQKLSQENNVKLVAAASTSNRVTQTWQMRLAAAMPRSPPIAATNCSSAV